MAGAITYFSSFLQSSYPKPNPFGSELQFNLCPISGKRIHEPAFTSCNNGTERLAVINHIFDSIYRSSKRPDWIDADGKITFTTLKESLHISDELEARIGNLAPSEQALLTLEESLEGPKGYINLRGLHVYEKSAIEGRILEKQSCPTCNKDQMTKVFTSSYVTRKWKYNDPEFHITNLSLEMKHWCNVHYQELEGLYTDISNVLERKDLAANFKQAFYKIDKYVHRFEALVKAEVFMSIAFKILLISLNILGNSKIETALQYINKDIQFACNVAVFVFMWDTFKLAFDYDLASLTVNGIWSLLEINSNSMLAYCGFLYLVPRFFPNYVGFRRLF